MGEMAIEAGATGGTIAGASVDEFRITMPATYGDVYAAEEIVEHASIVARRWLQPVHVELWRPLPAGGAVLCVVA
ncbi:MAG TPA: hypothetical protein VLJ38_19590, partial [Polyangiaceae bacterium]|nr:hypothetical protein [Polyangiaceae bacterium]